jgi:hypothetical protein
MIFYFIAVTDRVYKITFYLIRWTNPVFKIIFCFIRGLGDGGDVVRGAWSMRS